MLHRVTLVKTDVSEERNDSIIRFTRIEVLGKTLFQLLLIAKVVSSTPILVTLTMEATSSSEPSVLTRATQCKMTEDEILHSHRCKYLKSYIALTGWDLQQRSNVSPVR
jgi:hypothetical protein